jgi:hypothetical protein
MGVDVYAMMRLDRNDVDGTKGRGRIYPSDTSLRCALSIATLFVKKKRNYKLLIPAASIHLDLPRSSTALSVSRVPKQRNNPRGFVLNL